MEINNERQTYWAKLLLINIPVIGLLVSGILAVFLLIHTWVPVFISGGLVVSGSLAIWIFRMQYVKIKTEGDTILVLFYTLGILAGNYRRIEISKSAYAGSNMTSSVGGIRKELVMEEWVEGKKAIYPPVSVILFSKQDLDRIRELLGSV
jgi:hypothetical protein